jgi:hypothetical protein
MKIVMNNLRIHPFCVKVLNDSNSTNQRLIRERLEAFEKKKSYETKLNQLELYNSDVDEYVHNLLQAVDRMEYTLIFLNRFPKSATFAKKGIYRDKWDEYHYSVFIVTIVGIYDTVLLLLNAVFDLGLKPQTCNEETIANNRHIINSNVKKPLARMNSFILKFRHDRNIFLHRGKPVQVNLLSENDILESLPDHVDFEKHTKLMTSVYKRKLREFVKLMKSNISIITRDINNLFDAIEPVYEKRFNLIKNRINRKN